MNSLRKAIDVQVLRASVRTPGAAYPVGYPITWPRTMRLACSIGVGTPTAARTFSRSSRSLTAAGGRTQGSCVWGSVRENSGGKCGGRLPVALTSFLTSLPISSSSTAPTDGVEGGGS